MHWPSLREEGRLPNRSILSPGNVTYAPTAPCSAGQIDAAGHKNAFRRESERSHIRMRRSAALRSAVTAVHEADGARLSIERSITWRRASRYALPGGVPDFSPIAAACSAGSNGMTTSGRRSARA